MFLAQVTPYNLPTELLPDQIIPQVATNAEAWIIGSVAVVSAFILAAAVFKGITRRASQLIK